MGWKRKNIDLLPDAPDGIEPRDGDSAANRGTGARQSPDEPRRMRDRDWRSLDDSVVTLMNRAVAIRKEYEKLNETLKPLLNDCLERDLLYKEARRARQADEEIFMAFFREGGIRHFLQKFTDFTADRLDNLDDLEKIHLLAYNGALDMASYQFRQLEEKRSQIRNEPVPAPAPESFQQSVGWVFVDTRLESLYGELRKEHKKIKLFLKKSESQEGDWVSPVDVSALRKRLYRVSEELEELNAEKGENHSKLENWQTSLPPVPGEKYRDLHGALHHRLSEDSLEPVASVDGVPIEEYKQRLYTLADLISDEILLRWASGS